MKTNLLFAFLLLFSGMVSAQDTIFVRNGKPIPAIIVEKNNTEIKYKKAAQPESAAIYSIFVSDIASIHYKDGIVADYSQAGKDISNEPPSAIEMAGTMKSIRISIGPGVEYYGRNNNDDLLIFWKYYTGNNAWIGTNPSTYGAFIKANFTLGTTGRNWAGDEVQLNILPNDAVHASNGSGTRKLQLSASYLSIILYYGHTINHKKNIAAILEPGLDLSMMHGFFKFDSTKYVISGNFGSGFHIATGIDWVIVKRLTADFRIGYRFMKVKEMHKDETSSTGYSTFYVPPVANKEELKVKWNGAYIKLGLSWNFYAKLRGIK